MKHFSCFYCWEKTYPQEKVIVSLFEIRESTDFIYER